MSAAVAGSRRRRKVTDLQVRLAGEILRTAIEESLPAGHHLKETELAERLGVSRSPVRGALRYLADKGLVQSERNKGFTLKRAGDSLTPASLELPQTEDQALYDAIIGDRIDGLLGETQTEADLLRRYDTSRGVLARTLSRLAHEGVVRRSDGYGWRFTPTLDSEDAHDESYRFRLLIEPAGILEPTFEPDPARIRRCRERHHEMIARAGKGSAERELFETNAEFHEMIADFSGNRFILQAVQQQDRLRRLLEYRGMRVRERVLESCKEHLGILDALEAGDREWAARLMERHLTVASRLKLAYKDR